MERQTTRSTRTETLLPYTTRFRSHQVKGQAELLDAPAMHVEHAARADRVRVPLADALGEAAAVGDVAEHRLALGHCVAHFETSAAVRLRAAEEVEVGQIGRAHV